MKSFLAMVEGTDECHCILGMDAEYIS